MAQSVVGCVYLKGGMLRVYFKAGLQRVYGALVQRLYIRAGMLQVYRESVLQSGHVRAGLRDVQPNGLR